MESESASSDGAITTLPRPCLMLVTEPQALGRLIEILHAAVRGGVDIVQFRDKTARPEALADIVAEWKRLLLPALLVVNGCAFTEGTFGADGVHMPEHCASPPFGDGALVGRSIHSAAAARLAELAGADYVVAGTVYASGSHPDMPPAGLPFLEQICRAVTIPVVAIGGITPERVPECLGAGAAGVAVLAPIMRADDPCAVARRYRVALDCAWNAHRRQ